VEYITDVNAAANYHVCLDNEKTVKDKKKCKDVAIPTYEYGYKVDDNEYWELDINFEDGEEERDLGLDDGFEEEIVAFAGEETFGARKPDVHTNNVDDSNGVDVGNAHEDGNYDEMIMF